MISKLNQEQWDKKVIDLGGSILQSWKWGEFQESLGLKILRLSSDDFVALGVEIPLQFGKKYLYVPRGPVGEARSALIDIKSIAETDRSIMFARLEPQRTMDLPKAAKETQPLHNWYLSLDKSEEELLVGMKPKHRYNINLSARKGVVVREGRKEDLINVYQMLLETARRNNFHLHPQDYYWKIWEVLEQKHLKMLVAEYQGKFLAAVLLTLYGDTVTYLHGGSSSTMKEAMAPYLLHWEAIKMSKKMGFTHYDFGGIAPNEDQSHAWAGISRFKKGFGGYAVDFPGSYDLIFSPIWYNVYKQGRKLRNKLRR